MANEPIKINIATPDQLRSLRGVGKKLAQRIVEFREKQGPFRGPHDLAKVEGIGIGFAQVLNHSIDWQVQSRFKTINYLRRSRLGRFWQWLRARWWRWVGAVAIGVVAGTITTLLVVPLVVPLVASLGVNYFAQEAPAASEAAAPEEPLRIDYEGNKRREIVSAGVIRNFDPSKNLNYYKNSDLIAYSSPIIKMDVVSQVHDEWVKLEPYLIVEMTDVKPIPETVDYLGLCGDGGSAGSIDFFTATLSPNRDETFRAPQVLALQTDAQGAPSQQKPVPHFVLEPGEIETFQLTLNMVAGYYYHYRVGVPYSYKGTEDVKWIDRKFVAASPTKVDKEWRVTTEYDKEWNVTGTEIAESPQQQCVKEIQMLQQSVTNQLEREKEALQKYQPLRPRQ